MGRPSRNMCFNPYFTGCFSFRRAALASSTISARSFNPYFTGCFSFSPAPAFPVGGATEGFNPYFTGCFSFRLVKQSGTVTEDNVSILILLDASLLAPQKKVGNKTSYGFNPYFTGCFSFSQVLQGCDTRDTDVSILILLDASLLALNMLQKPLPQSLVSILILLDASLLDTSIFVRNPFVKVSILILLDASLLGGTAGTIIQNGLGFNPYFTGCFSFSILHVSIAILKF